MFRSCENKGFQIEFSNGYLVSCQFGGFNYCAKRTYDPDKFFKEREERIWESEDCEVAVINTNLDGGELNGFVTGEIFEQMKLEISNDEMVAGWVSADDVAKIIAYVSGLEATKDD